MMTIDSQIWIYYLDPAASENANITNWLDGKIEPGILLTEEIGMNAIIPLEIAHQIYRSPHINTDIAEKTLLSLISMKSCQIRTGSIYDVESIGYFKIIKRSVALVAGILLFWLQCNYTTFRQLQPMIRIS